MQRLGVLVSLLLTRVLLVVCVQFSIHKKWADFGAHSDWLKFEMERSNWSCAYCHQGAPQYNPLLSLKWTDFGALSDWSRAVSPPEGATCHPLLSPPEAMFCGNIVARGATGQVCRRL